MATQTQDALRKATEALETAHAAATDKAGKEKIWLAYKACRDALAAEPEQQPASSHSCHEEPTVVGFLHSQDGHEPYLQFRRDSCADHVEGLMTVTQHKRILTSPLREKKEGWISVDERMPDEETACLVYTPEGKDEPPRIDLEYFCDGCWNVHNDHYEHFCCIAKGGDENWTGPSAKAPYTHWMPLPDAPTQENQHG